MTCGRIDLPMHTQFAYSISLRRLPQGFGDMEPDTRVARDPGTSMDRLQAATEPKAEAVKVPEPKNADLGPGL